eukprot:3954448-Ditylum_brightwellii.AAC.1
MWTEFKDDVPENEKFILVMLLEMGVECISQLKIRSLYFGRVQNVPNVLEKAVPMAFHAVSSCRISLPEN